MDQTVETAGAANRVVIRIAGDVDIDSAPSLRYTVRELLEQGNRDLVIDVSPVDFIDSTGLGVLVGALKDAQHAGGTLELICTQRRMLNLLHLTGLDEAFTIHEVDIVSSS